jgi:hypothetical protein
MAAQRRYAAISFAGTARNFLDDAYRHGCYFRDDSRSAARQTSR